MQWWSEKEFLAERMARTASWVVGMLTNYFDMRMDQWDSPDSK
jgi:hypothetical protein